MGDNILRFLLGVFIRIVLTLVVEGIVLIIAFGNVGVVPEDVYYP